MKATELRIGNLIRLTDSDYWVTEYRGKIEEVSLDNLPDIYFHPKKALYEPIPLTEEWLLKFGFDKKTDTAQGIGDFSWYENEFLEMNHDVGGWFIIGTGLPIKRFQFVHQLQNLYFALTGEELSLTKEQSTATNE